MNTALLLLLNRHRLRSISIPQKQLTSDNNIAYQNTTFTNDMSPDGYSWANAHVLMQDSFGKYIALCQRQNGGTQQSNFVYSNNGTSWNDAGLSSAFLTRGTAVYDDINDLIHVLWVAAAASDGIIYRRYSITRDGSNNITGISQVAGVNLQLDLEDAGSMGYQHPLLLFLNQGTNGTLLAVWSARNNSGVSNKNEIRASMRALSNTTADNTASNWSAPVTTDTTSIGQSPQVPYSKLVFNNDSGIAYPSIGLLNDDLVLCYSASPSGVDQWRFRKAIKSGTNWSGGLTTDTLITNIRRSGTDSGYSLKYQLGSYVYQYGTSFLFGLATWKDDTLGDTWGYVIVDSDDTVHLVDVYSANGAHSYAPTGDVVLADNNILISYITTTDQFIRMAVYDSNGNQLQDISVHTATNTDIPLLRNFDNIIHLLFRDTTDQVGALLYRGLHGTLTWQ